MIVDALIRSRDGTIDPTDIVASVAGVPKKNNVPDLKRVESWVRTYLGIQELLEPLAFVLPDSPAIPQDDRTVELYCLGIAPAPNYASGSVQVTSQPVARIQRPRNQVFVSQIPMVIKWADLRAERASEILTQIDNQHAFWGMVVPFHNGRMKYTLDLIELVIQFTVFIESRFKHEFSCFRPADFSAQIQPMITTPGHSSLPCGHCTQGYATAHVLAALIGAGANDPRRLQLDRLAARISTNRLVAGVHFPVDNLAGRLLGQTLGEYVVERCAPKQGWTARSFDGSDPLLPNEDFRPFFQYLDTGATTYYQKMKPGLQGFPQTAKSLPDLWALALAECAYLQ
ncbi:MAG: phosphatase PAP2 family protein [Burkholderiales bacterium]